MLASVPSDAPAAVALPHTILLDDRQVGLLEPPLHLFHLENVLPLGDQVADLDGGLLLLGVAFLPSECEVIMIEKIGFLLFNKCLQIVDFLFLVSILLPSHLSMHIVTPTHSSPRCAFPLLLDPLLDLALQDDVLVSYFALDLLGNWEGDIGEGGRTALAIFPHQLCQMVHKINKIQQETVRGKIISMDTFVKGYALTHPPSNLKG